ACLSIGTAFAGKVARKVRCAGEQIALQAEASLRPSATAKPSGEANEHHQDRSDRADCRRGTRLGLRQLQLHEGDPRGQARADPAVGAGETDGQYSSLGGRRDDASGWRTAVPRRKEVLSQRDSPCTTPTTSPQNFSARRTAR